MMDQLQDSQEAEQLKSEDEFLQIQTLFGCWGAKRV